MAFDLMALLPTSSGMLVMITIGLILCGVLLGSLGVIGYFVMVWLYPYKFSYRPIYGDITMKEDGKVVIGTGGITFGKRHWARMGIAKGGGQWKILWSKKRIPPMPIKVILPGRQIDGYKLPGDRYISSTHEIAKHLDLVEAHMNAIWPEAKSHAINELEAYARKYDPRTQMDKLKMIGAWVLAGIVMFGLLVAGSYFGFQAYKYGVDKGDEAALHGQEICGVTIARQIAEEFGVMNRTLAAQPSNPLSTFPLPLAGGIPQ